MRIRLSFVVLLSLLAGPALYASAATNSSASFTLSSKSNVPGATLKPGSYTIQVLNRLSDRSVLQIDDAKGKVKATFLGVPDKKIARPGESGPVAWDNPVKKTTYLKGWYFPDSAAVIEFVYPKAEAVSIATSNPAKVPAVDPASQGMVADKNLSQGDMQLLTLWLLSLEEVGPGAPAGGIKAERYEVASNADYKPSIKSLPHTAGSMPLVWLLGFCSLIAACSLRWFQRSYPVRVTQAPFSGKE